MCQHGGGQIGLLKRMRQHVGTDRATQQSRCWGALEGMLKCGAYEQKSFWGKVGAGLGNVIKELLEAVTQ